MSDLRTMKEKTSKKQETRLRKINEPDLSPGSGTAHDQTMVLHQTIGNKAMGRLLRSGFIQPKLTVSHPNDIHEREAGRVADEVMCMPDAVMQRQPMEEEEQKVQTKPIAARITSLVQRVVPEEEEEKLQTKPIFATAPPLAQRQPEKEDEEFVQTEELAGGTPEVSSKIEGRISTLQGGGQPLSNDVRAYMEPRFGVDFSQVRVHADAGAVELARAVNAHAFAVGKDIVFGDGQYAPHSDDGKKLLAHELTHVVQQGGGGRLSRAGLQREEKTVATTAETTDPSIEALDLDEKAKKAAYELKKKHPTISFTSGRRTAADQARAMAANIVSDGRKWIENTYSSTTGSKKLQKWVDDHPKATTAEDIGKGLEEVLNSLSDVEKSNVSKHITGAAFDVQPQTEQAEKIKADIQALPGITKFLEKEGGLVRWHAQFKKISKKNAGDTFEQEADRAADEVMRLPDPVIQTKAG